MSSPGRELASSSFAMIARRQISDLTVRFGPYAPPGKADDNASRNCSEGSPFHDDQARGENGRSLNESGTKTDDGRKIFYHESHQQHAGAIVAGLGESGCSTRKVK